MRRVKTLFLPHPVPDLHEPWGVDTLAAISRNHDVSVFDPSQDAAPQMEGIEAIVDLGGNISGELVGIAARAGVRFVQAQTNGLDHVEVDAIRDAGMKLAHCPGNLSSVALAEAAMMYILMLANRYGEGRENFQSGKAYFPTGMELVGRSLLIVGFGASGQELARRAKSFGMRILGIDIRQIEPEIVDELQPEFLGTPDDLDGLLSDCDFVSVHLHLTDATRHTLDARRIGLLKSTACVINVARGALIDEDALYQALVEGRIGGAGLDAFATEPSDPTLPAYQLPNVCVQPHVAGATDGTSRKRAEFAASNLDRLAQGEELGAQVV